MQSFLQYRRFRRAVEEQERGAKNKLSTTGRRTDVPDVPDSPSSADASQEKDVEKGDAGSDTSDPQPLTTADVDAQQPIGTFSHGHNTTPHVHPSEEVEQPAQEEEGEEERHQHGDRELRQYLTRMSTQRTTGSAELGHAMTGIQVRKRNTHEGGDGRVFIVGYHDEKDMMNPHNWSHLTRVWITFLVASIGFVVGVASSIDSMALPQASMEFGVSEVVESMATGRQPLTSQRAFRNADSF